jgi:glycosyltransferase involved in cell wall biosynthesis
MQARRVCTTTNGGARMNRPLQKTYETTTVAVIATVKNEADNIRSLLDALLAQSRKPDEIIIVDGGSDDGTVELIHEYALSTTEHGIDGPAIRLIDRSSLRADQHCNIACGRNIATAAATSDVIATTDAGCLPERDWLKNLIAPFEQDSTTEFVAGVYEMNARSLFERIVGLATMRGQLEPFDSKTFNPSARSLAYRKTLWERIGGWPEWLRYSEDTLFDHKVRQSGAVWRHAGDAIVHWRPRTSYRALARQFYHYGTGRGHTKIDAESFRYNLRNAIITTVSGIASLLTPWAAALFVGCFTYFYVWAHHDKARRISQKTGRIMAYPLSLLVLWVVVGSHLTGYLVGSWQRRRCPEEFGKPYDAYMGAASVS